MASRDRLLFAPVNTKFQTTLAAELYMLFTSIIVFFVFFLFPFSVDPGILSIIRITLPSAEPVNSDLSPSTSCDENLRHFTTFNGP